MLFIKDSVLLDLNRGVGAWSWQHACSPGLGQLWPVGLAGFKLSLRSVSILGLLLLFFGLIVLSGDFCRGGVMVMSWVVTIFLDLRLRPSQHCATDKLVGEPLCCPVQCCSSKHHHSATVDGVLFFCLLGGRCRHVRLL